MHVLLLDAPDQVQLRASSLTPRNGSSVTLTCSAHAIPPPTMYIFTKGSSQTTVQNSSSPTYTIGTIDYRNFVKYNAMFACVAYNLVGAGSSSNVTLNIQGMWDILSQISSLIYIFSIFKINILEYSLMHLSLAHLILLIDVTTS